MRNPQHSTQHIAHAKDSKNPTLVYSNSSSSTRAPYIVAPHSQSWKLLVPMSPFRRSGAEASNCRYPQSKATPERQYPILSSFH